MLVREQALVVDVRSAGAGDRLLWRFSRAEGADLGAKAQKLIASEGGKRLGEAGVMAVVTGEDGQILVWNAATGMLDKQLTASSSPVNSLVFGGKNKNLLFAGSDDNRFVRWNVARRSDGSTQSLRVRECRARSAGDRRPGVRADCDPARRSGPRWQPCRQPTRSRLSRKPARFVAQLIHQLLARHG